MFVRARARVCVPIDLRFSSSIPPPTPQVPTSPALAIISTNQVFNGTLSPSIHTNSKPTDVD